MAEQRDIERTSLSPLAKPQTDMLANSSPTLASSTKYLAVRPAMQRNIQSFVGRIALRERSGLTVVMTPAWVIKDYASEKLDLSSAESYREYVL